MVDEDVPLGARRARPGDDRPGRHLLRAAHDPGDGASWPRRSPSTRPDAWLINFTNPAGMVTEAVQQVLGDRAVGICDSPVGPVPARRRARSAATPERAVVRLLRPQPPRLAAGACATRDRRPAARELLEDDARAGRLRGGPPVRRRVAALARDDPERVPLLLLLRGGHGRRDPRAARLARRVPARAAARVLRAQRRSAAARRWPPGARRATTASAPTWPRRAAPPATRPSTSDDANGGYEGEAMAVLEAIALNTPRGADPQHRQPLRAAVPGRARGRRGARASSAAPARCRWPIGPGARARARARRDDEGRRAHDDRRGADRLARARGQGARAAPARAVGQRPRARSSTATARGCPTLQEALRRDERRPRRAPSPPSWT